MWRDLAAAARLQVWTAVVGALALIILMDQSAGFAFSYGVILITSGTLLSARFGLRVGANPVAGLIFVLSSLAWKWLWILAGFYIAILRLELPAVWLVLGVVLAQLVGIYAGIRVGSNQRGKD
jgi:hypothetical protein